MKKFLASVIPLLIVAIQPLLADLPPIRLTIEDNQREMSEILTKKAFWQYENWVAYGTFQAAPYNFIDNPETNICGIDGEVTLPYTVPDGHSLTIHYLQIEGPASPQVGMALWLGDYPCDNSKCLISCTTAGGSTQLEGFSITINAGQKVNIRVMNNTALPWVNGFFLQGCLTRAEK